MNKPLRRTPMRRKSRKQRPGKDAAHMARVAQLPCVICHEYSMPQLSPTQVHHTIHGRNSMGAKSPDIMTLPLCEGHHLGDFDTSKIALHRSPAEWKENYGLDVEWLSWVEEQLNRRGGRLAVRGQCEAKGCEKRAENGDYCAIHYRRIQRTGKEDKTQAARGEVQAWIETILSHEGEACLPYPFSQEEGYYSLSLPGGGWTKVHREICRRRHGEPPEHAHAMHRCGNKSCVNPRHLEWGSPKQNAQDRITHGTQPRGENASNVLTEKDVREIRRRYAAGESQREIANDYQCGKGNIWCVVHRKTWTHVE